MIKIYHNKEKLPECIKKGLEPNDKGWKFIIVYGDSVNDMDFADEIAKSLSSNFYDGKCRDEDRLFIDVFLIVPERTG